MKYVESPDNGATGAATDFLLAIAYNDDEDSDAVQLS